LIAGAIALVVVVYDFIPLLRTGGELKRSIQRADSKVRSLSQEERRSQEERMTQDLKVRQQRLNQLQAMLDQINERTDEEQNLPLVIMKLEGLISDTGLDMTSLSPVEVGGADGPQADQLELVLQGRYAQLMDFLSKINEQVFFIAVERLSVEKSELIAPKQDFRLYLNVFSRQ